MARAFVKNKSTKVVYNAGEGVDRFCNELLAEGWTEKTGADLTATLIEQKILETKAEAQRRIYAVIPQWKQYNINSRNSELAYKVEQGTVLTQAEKDERTAGFALLAKKDAVRAASDLIEADIKASTDPASIDVINNPRWPA